MSHLDLSGCKKRKRGERPVFKFKTFGEPGHPVAFTGSFIENINALLGCGGNFDRNVCSKMLGKSFQLEVQRRQPTLHIMLVVIEESIEGSLHRNCQHCQYVGWSHQVISNKNYHILLPSKQKPEARSSFVGNCGEELKNSQKGKCNLIEVEGHMLHGVFHSNGFGHLLCVNGVETGSEVSGYQIMDLWDRLCTSLQARKVSVNDISQKRGMKWRLLHGVAYSQPWFGRWGYIFGRGSFGVTQTMYQKAIEAIQAMPLCALEYSPLSSNSSNHNISVGTIFSKYQVIASQYSRSLTTLQDLFHFILELKSHISKKDQPENNLSSGNADHSFRPSEVELTACRWSPKRVEMAARVIVEALRRAEYRWVSRQEVRDAARAYIGDTGLLDYVLKSLGNHVFGNFLVRRTLNPVTKVLEYCLVDITCIALEPTAATKGSTPQRTNLTGNQLMKDLSFLYKTILHSQQKQKKQSSAVLTAIPVAARIILDTKLLIKEYSTNSKFNQDYQHESESRRTRCSDQLMTRDEEGDDDLKRDVEERCRETDYGLRDLAVDSISDLVPHAVGWEQNKIAFHGIGGGRGEGERAVVECRCGGGGDGLERLICCDICEVWEHSRCVGLEDEEQLPNMFLCSRCEQVIVLSPSLL